MQHMTYKAKSKKDKMGKDTFWCRPGYPFRGLTELSLLPFLEHHIGGPWDTQYSDAKLGRGPFPVLKLYIIRNDQVGKQELELTSSSKEPSWTKSEV